ncbi:hypothetical protein PMAYCL1PPCAC_17673, partial [Pristionchus mayeri]
TSDRQQMIGYCPQYNPSQWLPNRPSFFSMNQLLEWTLEREETSRDCYWSGRRITRSSSRLTTRMRQNC